MDNKLNQPTSLGDGTRPKNTIIPPTNKTLDVNKKAYFKE